MKSFIEENKICIIYFSGSECSACDVIKIKLENIIASYKEIKIKEVNALREKEVSAQLNVFTLPLAILYIEGKEHSRYGRNINILEFKETIERYYNFIYK